MAPLPHDELLELILKRNVVGIGNTDEIVALITQLLNKKEFHLASRVINRYLTHIEDRSPIIRYHAAKILGHALKNLHNHPLETGALNAIHKRIAQLLRDPDTQVFQLAYRQVVKANNRTITPILKTIITKTTRLRYQYPIDRRCMAVRGIGIVGDIKDIPFLRTLLFPKRWNRRSPFPIQLATVIALTGYSTPSSQEILDQVRIENPHLILRLKAPHQQ